MKIFYVKSNSERAKEFQLKTIIYEENGQKYVKKEAMVPEAIPHLKKMKENYKRLSDAIINPKIKLAKIVEESNTTLTFEFIEGISLEKRYNQAKKSTKAQSIILEEYLLLLKNSFKTIPFDVQDMVTDSFKDIFGDYDYSGLQGEPTFEGISNIDLIFSNIIFKENFIYLIDYEWVFDLNIPVSFSAFRALHTPNDLYWKMEKHFVFDVVVGDYGFLNIQENYKKRRLIGLNALEKKDNQIVDLQTIIKDKESVIHDKDVHIQTQEETLVNFKNLEKSLQKIIHDKNVHIQTQEELIEEHTALSKSLKSIIHDKETHIVNQETQIANQETHIVNQETQIANLQLQLQAQFTQLSGDIEHWHNIAKELTIKGRSKKLIKKILPLTLVERLKATKNTNNLSEAQHSSLPQQEDTPPPAPVENKYCYCEPCYTDSVAQNIETFKHKPLISIIMPVYNVSPKWLDLAIKSIEAQWYDNWELCIADDKSTNRETIDYLHALNHPKIKVSFLETNLNISGASNEALKLTSGEYIALMDNDDEITPDALYEVVKAILENGAEFIYSDEDKIEMDNTFSDPNFKPDFAPDMFFAHNYLSHLGVIKKSLITKVGGFTIGLEGSQDYDLYLKVLEHTNKIYHISKVLYHWRKIPGSTAAEYGEKSYAQEAGRKSLEKAMQRRNIAATVKNGQTPGTYKVDYTIKENPLVSIVIPFKDKPELIQVCIESILDKSTYENFEIIAISNNSTEEATFKEIERLKALDARIFFYEYNIPFNYSQINNYAVQTYAKGEHILFLNNDIEIITPTWIEEMLMYSQQMQNGAIGAKLYFPNETIQHAGLVMVPKTIHSVILVYQGYPKEYYGYGSRLRCVNNYSAVTAACLMVKRSIFDEINGFDAKNLSVAYNDVDFCLRIQELGYHNIWTPYCEAYHHESISRGYEISRESVERREKEKYNLKQKHPKIFTEGDPYYNKNLSRFSVNSDIDESVQKTHQNVEGIPFYEEILFAKNIQKQKHHRICIFSHYDANNAIQAYVIEYLKALSEISDIVFVSTAEKLNDEILSTIEPYCRDIIVKKNIGYDFGAWKSGLDALGETLDNYEELILCNDSVFGPFYSLKDIFETMSSYDVWSMSDNNEIAYHLQSYFMVYRKKALCSNIFKTFWDTFEIYLNKQMIIEKNEIDYSSRLIHSDLKCGAYYSVIDKNYVNVLQYYWEELITKHNFPFIKKEVLTTNPLQLDTSNWQEVIASVSTYDTKMITDVITSDK